AVFSAIFTIFAGICAGVWAVAVWRREAKWRREDRHAELLRRNQELQWKQAELARQLLDEIFDFPPSEGALDMLDGESEFSEFEDAGAKRLKIGKSDIQHALRVGTVAGKRSLLDSASEKEQRADKHIRYCFDSLFYYLERLERSVATNVVRFEDLLASSGY